MLLPDERTLKPAKSPVLAPSPLLTKPASTPRVHSSSAPTSAYQEYRQGERDSSPVSKPKPSVHPHLPSGHISSPPRPAVRKESEWSAADEHAAIRRAQTKLKTSIPAKPSKPLVTHEDDASETRRFHNQVAAARQPSAPPRVYPANFIGPIAPGATRQSSPPKPESSKPRVYPANFLGPIAPGARRTAPSNPALKAAEHAVGGAVAGAVIGSTKAGTRTSVPSPLKQAKDVFKFVEENERNVGRAALESELKSSGWVRVDGRWADGKTVEAYEKGVRSTIWTNPSREESIRITPDPKKVKGSSLRAYDGPSGGAVNSLMKDPGNNGWMSQGKEGKKSQPLARENPLDIHGNRGPDPGHTYKNTAKETHAELRPESNNGIVRALQNNRVVGALQNTPVAQSIGNSRISQSVERGLAKGPLRIAGRAALPLAAAVDAYDLTKTYQQDGFGPKFRSEAAGVAGGWGTAFAAGAAGTAICGPLCGIAAGAGGYLVGSGAASKLEEGVEKAAPKVLNGIKSAGSAIKDGAKSVLSSINPFD